MLSAMSLNEHRPNQKKRGFSEISVEFPPSLSVQTFPACPEFARKSRESLVSVQQELASNGLAFPGTSSIFLSLISPHALQYRFNVGRDDNAVFLIKRYPGFDFSICFTYLIKNPYDWLKVLL